MMIPSDPHAVRAMSDADVVATIEGIEENVAETGRRSSYYHRMAPVLRAARAEARRRGVA